MTLLPIILTTLLIIMPTACLGQNTLIKLDAMGRELPDDAAEWAMVRDPAKGLTWEVKTDDGSIHDKNNSYSWKKHNKEFLAKLNEEKFGGFSDWRLPEETELEGLVDRAKEQPPRINEKYFPQTSPSIHLGWSLCQDGSLNVSKINFGPKPTTKKRVFSIRAVRGEFKE
ncbi:MAG: DUF1566 domain-containing protein [Thermodesulfobacteriota bacterium]